MMTTRPGPLVVLLATLLLAPLSGRGQTVPALTPSVVPEPTVSAAPAATPATLKITLRWTTASELDNYGFFVMRSNAEEGPFKPLHLKAIPGAGNSEMPHNYTYNDVAVELGKTYHYYVESVSTRGEREKFTPVITKQCCKPAPTLTAIPQAVQTPPALP